MCLHLGECPDKWLCGCLFLAHNKMYLRARLILVWDQNSCLLMWLGFPLLAGHPPPLKRITVSEILVMRIQRGISAAIPPPAPGRSLWHCFVTVFAFRIQQVRICGERRDSTLDPMIRCSLRQHIY